MHSLALGPCAHSWTSTNHGRSVQRQRATAGMATACCRRPRGRVARRLLVLGTLAPAVNPAAASAAFVSEATTVITASVSESTTVVGLVEQDTPQAPTAAQLPPDNPPTYVRATGRVVAIGDLHGDWHKAIDSFRMAGVIKVNEKDEVVWCGGDTVVVQLGDVLDRGDHEIAIVNLLRGLDQQARQHGGAVYMLNGNHESLNICGDFRYVTPGAFLESAAYAGFTEEQCRDWELLARVRFAVYKPGGPMARELAKNPTVLVVNDTAFAHGGLLPTHANYGVERLNNEVAAWMRGDSLQDGGKAAPPFLAMGDGSSVMWNRTLSRERFPSPYEKFHACASLKQALTRINAKRLVVGHTPQLGGVNCECEGCVWRVDVGMSYGVLNRPVQILEIAPNPDGVGDSVVRILPDTGAGSSIDDDLSSVEI